jgi:hypothetical protein
MFVLRLVLRAVESSAVDSAVGCAAYQRAAVGTRVAV